jgi:hypothetical protein
LYRNPCLIPRESVGEQATCGISGISLPNVRRVTARDDLHSARTTCLADDILV